MFEKYDGWLRAILSILLFPTFFQNQFFAFAWGSGDPLVIMLLKRIFVLLPTTCVIFSLWISIACGLTIIIRAKRREFVSAIFVTWWDLGRSILSFWGGSFKFVFYFFGWLLGFVRLTLLGIWLTLQDMLFIPLRMIKTVGSNVFEPGVPWLAVIMTTLWCLLEAMVFTFVTTPLVMDVISGITSSDLSEGLVQIFLFLMMFAFVVGSYAIVASLQQALRTRDIRQIALVGMVEFVAMVFEVMFLYREFVDALVPWFAQHSDNKFSLGIFGTIFIATIVWLGIRGMTWFLFAKSGTPTIMAIIQRTGLKKENVFEGHLKDQFTFIRTALDHIKKDITWSQHKGEELLNAFILPPLQVIAATINFCTLLISKNHLFNLPIQNIKDIVGTDQLIKRAQNAIKD